jgi:CBS domain containing-hemolysin-like protein
VDSVTFHLPLLLLLLAAAALFAGAETALFSLTRQQRRRLEKAGDPAGEAATRLLRNPRELLAGLLFGGVLAQVAFAALLMDLLGEVMGTGPAAAAAVGISLVVLLIPGSIVPRVLAAASPLAFVQATARPVAAATSFLKLGALPLGWVSRQLARRLLPEPAMTNPVPEPASGSSRAPTDDDLLEYLDEFHETVAREVMTPRMEILAADLDWPPERLPQFVRKAKVSLLPLYRGNLDNIESLLRVKPYLLAGRCDLKPFLARPYFIPEGKKIHDLWREFQTRKPALAIVLDEHGQTTGLITMEDILEEIFGEVYDEGEPEEEAIVPLPSGGWRVRGRALLSDVEREIGLALEADEGIDTLGGLVMNYLGEIPRRGDSFIVRNHNIQITKVVRHRVQEVRVQSLSTMRTSAGGSGETGAPAGGE